MEPFKKNSHTIKRLQDGAEWLKEAISLIQENSLDSLLRYYQTGFIQNMHLPSALLPYDHSIAEMLAEKLMNVIGKTGFQIQMEEVKETGRFPLFYQKGEYRCYFAQINPYERTVSYNFDFGEMEREREIKISKLKTQRNEIYERYKDIQDYLQENNKGLGKFKHKTMIEQMKQSLESIPEEITEIEKELKEIGRDKVILEELQKLLPELQFELRRYGFLFEATKGEDFEI